MGRTRALIAGLLAGCYEPRVDVIVDAPAIDAGIDAPIDADLVNVFVPGRYLDWDSTAAAPCPIVGAKWTARYDNSRVATTDANGDFSIKLASYLTELDVTQPATAATCATGNYTMPAIAILPPAVHTNDGLFVARALTDARITTFYAAIGTPFDTTRGQLFVHFHGPSRAVSISSAHAAVQAFDGTTWAAGSTGIDVFFPNIVLGSEDMTTVSVTGGATGTGAVTLAAGTITFMTVVTN